MAIEFVGGAVAGKAGDASATSTIALDAGLTGGSRSSVQEDDLVIALFGVAATADATLSITDGTTEYTLVTSQLYVNDGSDAILRMAYKFMGATPDTATTFGPSTNAAWGAATAVYVFSGVDQTTPMDVTPQNAIGFDGCRPDPAAITPTTSGAYIVVGGIGALSTSGGGTTYTSSDLTDFMSVVGTDNDDCQLGIGHKVWTSGEFNPATFTGGTSNTNSSWAATTLALRPASTTISGTLAKTEANDTTSSVGKVKLKATASKTEANDTTTSASKLKLIGTVALTEDSDVSLSQSGLLCTGTASLLEADDTLSALIVLNKNGIAALLEENDTLTSSADVLLFASVSPVESDDTLSSTGVLGLVGMLSRTESDDVLTAIGTTQDIIYGLVAVAEENDSATSSGFIRLEGSALILEANDTSVALGTITKEGTLNVTEENDTLESTSYTSTTGFRAYLWDKIGIVIGP